MALEFLQQCMYFFGIIVPQFVGCLLGSYIVELMVNSSKSTYATCCASQICYSLSLCAVAVHCWPMPLQEALRHSNPGLTWSLLEVIDSFSGSYYVKGFVCTLWVSLVGLRFDFAPPIVLLRFLLCRWTWGIFFWWDPTFSCWLLLRN